MGDDCLKAVAKTLSASLYRAADFAARYGGEEFVVVLSNTGKSGAFEIAERIRKNIEDLNIAHQSSQISTHVTISLGVCNLVNFKDTNLQDFIRSADRALYAAKQAGRNSTISVDY
jgi:diguanylate cyclase (GGDEF)-like protein